MSERPNLAVPAGTDGTTCTPHFWSCYRCARRPRDKLHVWPGRASSGRGRGHGLSVAASGLNLGSGDGHGAPFGNPRNISFRAPPLSIMERCSSISAPFSGSRMLDWTWLHDDKTSIRPHLGTSVDGSAFVPRTSHDDQPWAGY